MHNALVIMFDSLQFNYLGCYGNTWIKTPNMDRLAREGVLFENAYTEGLPTIPCRRGMHTGRYTLPFAGWVPLTMADTTIADLCWGRPIDTAFIFDSGPHRLPKFGYTRGFDKVWFTHGHETDDFYYENDPLLHHNVRDYFDDKSVAIAEHEGGKEIVGVAYKEVASYLKMREQVGAKGEDRYVAKTVGKAIEYLEQVDRNKQFFLWIDSFDPHEPWDAPSVYDPETPCPYNPNYTGKDEFLPFPTAVEGLYTEEQMHHVRMLYAEIVTLCDFYLGKLMDTLRRLGFEENTLLWMVSDHGEPMGNGEHGHGIFRKCRPWPYEELVHVPYLLRVPGAKPGQRIKAFIQSCDVAPTVCDWLGIGVHPDMQGKSLLPLVFGQVEKVRDFAIAGYYPYSWAIFTDDWSYIHWNKERNIDPLEMVDFYSESIDNSHLKGGNADLGMWDKSKLGSGIDTEASKRQQQNATTDGEAQWTCTPTSTAEVPDTDELYDRKKDPFQLNNVIGQYPAIAKELLGKLRAFMEELKAS